MAQRRRPRRRERVELDAARALAKARTDDDALVEVQVGRRRVAVARTGLPLHERGDVARAAVGEHRGRRERDRLARPDFRGARRDVDVVADRGWAPRCASAPRRLTRVVLTLRPRRLHCGRGNAGLLRAADLADRAIAVACACASRGGRRPVRSPATRAVARLRCRARPLVGNRLRRVQRGTNHTQYTTGHVHGSPRLALDRGELHGHLRASETLLNRLRRADQRIGRRQFRCGPPRDRCDLGLLGCIGFGEKRRSRPRRAGNGGLKPAPPRVHVGVLRLALATDECEPRLDRAAVAFDAGAKVLGFARVAFGIVCLGLELRRRLHDFIRLGGGFERLGLLLSLRRERVAVGRRRFFTRLPCQRFDRRQHRLELRGVDLPEQACGVEGTLLRLDRLHHCGGPLRFRLRRVALVGGLELQRRGLGGHRLERRTQLRELRVHPAQFVQITRTIPQKIGRRFLCQPFRPVRLRARDPPAAPLLRERYHATARPDNQRTARDHGPTQRDRSAGCGGKERGHRGCGVADDHAAQCHDSCSACGIREGSAGVVALIERGRQFPGDVGSGQHRIAQARGLRDLCSARPDSLQVVGRAGRTPAHGRGGPSDQRRLRGADLHRVAPRPPDAACQPEVGRGGRRREARPLRSPPSPVAFELPGDHPTLIVALVQRRRVPRHHRIGLQRPAREHGVDRVVGHAFRRRRLAESVDEPQRVVSGVDVRQQRCRILRRAEHGIGRDEPPDARVVMARAHVVEASRGVERPARIARRRQRSGAFGRDVAECVEGVARDDLAAGIRCREHAAEIVGVKVRRTAVARDHRKRIVGAGVEPRAAHLESVAQLGEHVVAVVDEVGTPAVLLTPDPLAERAVAVAHRLARRQLHSREPPLGVELVAARTRRVAARNQLAAGIPGECRLAGLHEAPTCVVAIVGAPRRPANGLPIAGRAHHVIAVAACRALGNQLAGEVVSVPRGAAVGVGRLDPVAVGVVAIAPRGERLARCIRVRDGDDPARGVVLEFGRRSVRRRQARHAIVVVPRERVAPAATLDRRGPTESVIRKPHHAAVRIRAARELPGGVVRVGDRLAPLRIVDAHDAPGAVVGVAHRVVAPPGLDQASRGVVAIAPLAIRRLAGDETALGVVAILGAAAVGRATLDQPPRRVVAKAMPPPHG